MYTIHGCVGCITMGDNVLMWHCHMVQCSWCHVRCHLHLYGHVGLVPVSVCVFDECILVTLHDTHGGLQSGILAWSVSWTCVQRCVASFTDAHIPLCAVWVSVQYVSIVCGVFVM